jgi:hypothetical protein
VIPMRMAQDHVIDAGELGLRRLEEREEPILRPGGEVVVRPAVVDEGRPPHDPR